MDKSTLRTVLLLAAVFFLVWTLVGKGCNKDKGPNTNVVALHHCADGKCDDVVAKLPSDVPLGAPCVIRTVEFEATVAPGAGRLQHPKLLRPKTFDAEGQI